VIFVVAASLPIFMLTPPLAKLLDDPPDRFPSMGVSQFWAR